MTEYPGTFTNPWAGRWRHSAMNRYLPLVLWAGIVAALFFQLGAAPLFEPDEGRNAEKAREILVLRDWVTPHENFHPVLDKPIFFYWTVAIAYKLFGVSEWAARLPSALAALGTLALIYRFTHAHWGRWTALWSGLILLTNVEFFALARTVIFDVMLTFFTTLSLCAFYEAMHNESSKQRRIWSLLTGLGIGAAALTKGLVGIVVPGMVIFAYVLFTAQWRALKRMNLFSAVLLALLVAAPWYLFAESRNPGYLRYYLWEEHFGRFVTDEFDRAQGWYYFVAVLFVGFMPWSLLVPLFAREAVKKMLRGELADRAVYLMSWTILPFLFFSISKSKLPHYILPIFPALAMLTAAALVRAYQQSPKNLQRALSLTWWVQVACSGYFLLGQAFPPSLPEQVRAAVASMPYFLFFYAAVTGVILVYMKMRRSTGQPRSQSQLFVVQGLGLWVFLFLTVKMMVLVAPERSAKDVAAAALKTRTPAARVVQYDTYLAGLAFYLRSERPVWLVTRNGKERKLLGNYYAIGKREKPTTRWGQAIFNLQEFHAYWSANERPLLVVVKDKNLARFTTSVGAPPLRLASAHEYLLVAKPRGSILQGHFSQSGGHE